MPHVVCRTRLSRMLHVAHCIRYTCGMPCVVRSALHEWHHYSRSSRHRFVTDSDHSRCMRHVMVDLMNVVMLSVARPMLWHALPVCVAVARYRQTDYGWQRDRSATSARRAALQPAHRPDETCPLPMLSRPHLYRGSLAPYLCFAGTSGSPHPYHINQTSVPGLAPHLHRDSGTSAQGPLCRRAARARRAPRRPRILA
jgi:hypothetical protein